MANSTDTYPTEPHTVTTDANFIPAMWSNEVIATYKSNLVVANQIRRMPFHGKKGNTIHVPKPFRGVASSKIAGTDVTLNVSTAGVLDISITEHYEYSRLIEDIVDVQALARSEEHTSELQSQR